MGNMQKAASDDQGLLFVCLLAIAYCLFLKYLHQFNIKYQFLSG